MSAKAGEPFWESPWGPRRPGWHIECSAISSSYLVYSFDIHGGGMDLIFPHHENEISQSCAACNKSNVSYWIHNELVTIDSEKMSKSLGNFFTIQQVIDSYHPLALRLFLVGTHYQSPINYSHVQLEKKGSIPPDILRCIDKFNDEVLVSMLDDLHTPVALSALTDPLKTINDLLHTRKGKKQLLRIVSLAALEETIRSILSVLGLMPTSYSEILNQLREKAHKRAKITEEHIMQKIEQRTIAKNK